MMYANRDIFLGLVQYRKCLSLYFTQDGNNSMLGSIVVRSFCAVFYVQYSFMNLCMNWIVGSCIPQRCGASFFGNYRGRLHRVPGNERVKREQILSRISAILVLQLYGWEEEVVFCVGCYHCWKLIYSTVNGPCVKTQRYNYQLSPLRLTPVWREHYEHWGAILMVTILSQRSWSNFRWWI